MSTPTLTERAEKHRVELYDVIEKAPFMSAGNKAVLCEGAALMAEIAKRLDHITPHIDEG